MEEYEPLGAREPDYYRLTPADERAFLARLRTAFALIVGGVAVVQLDPALAVPETRHALGALLTAGGGLLAALAVRRRQRVQAAMRRSADLPPARLPALLGIAILAVTVLVLALFLALRP